ncbi:MAG: 50S ribosome-binding GTPase, partial [Spirochaetales bacterium]|nr:50S ribosome-binding GTPase [Spirochaetales bacterium]
KTQRGKRERSSLKTGSIVGYTNAGKSSLLKALVGGDLYIADKLFATLDPTTRRVYLPSENGEVLLTDTVGFIRRLPHELIEAFKSTLEETVLADFLIQVLDASDPHLEDHARTTRKILGQIGAVDKPVITVFNKIDLCEDAEAVRALAAAYPNPVIMSAATAGNEGVTELLAVIGNLVHEESVDASSFAVL